MNRKKFNKLSSSLIILRLASILKQKTLKIKWDIFFIVILGIFLFLILICFLLSFTKFGLGKAYNWAGPLATASSTIAALWFSTHGGDKPEIIVRDINTQILYSAITKRVNSARYEFSVINVGKKTDILTGLRYYPNEIFKSQSIAVFVNEVVEIFVTEYEKSVCIEIYKEEGKRSLEPIIINKNISEHEGLFYILEKYAKGLNFDQAEVNHHIMENFHLYGLIDFNQSRSQIVHLNEFELINID